MTPEKRRLAVILPGIGYTCDRPLLYYSGKLAKTLGWEVLTVPYGGFPPKVRGDQARMRQCVEIALAQTESALGDVDWTQCDSILFISKSVGTVVAAAYASRHSLPCRHILFTPVEDTFSFAIPQAAAFHGTADPWADTARIVSLCEQAGIPLFITPNANHSLETGDVRQDIRILDTVMEQIRPCLLPGEAASAPVDPDPSSVPHDP